MSSSTSASASPVSTRPASLQDADDHFVLTAFDSALPYLASIGSGAQWGSVPFTKKGNRVKEMHDFCARSERTFAAAAAAADATPETRTVSKSDWAKLLIAQMQDTRAASSQSPPPTRVGAVGLSRHAPEYVATALPQIFPSRTSTLSTTASAIEGEFIYVNYLIVHRDPLGITGGDSEDTARSLALGKGAGALLLQQSIDIAHDLGIGTLFVDCWAGNGRKLVQYYERQGFRLAGDFEVQDKHGSGMLWSGALLRMDLDSA
ncbi:hypothetical protein V8E36_004305 [Tilletia maclaganii]